MATKSPKSGKRRTSDREFVKEFTTLVSKRLSSLPAAEQDKRIQAATRVVTKIRRASSSKAPVTAGTQDYPEARTR